MLVRHARCSLITQWAKNSHHHVAVASFCALRSHTSLERRAAEARAWPRCRSSLRHGHLQHGRGLATATDDLNFDPTPFENFDNPTLPPLPSSSTFQTRDFRRFDPSTPLTIPEPGPARPLTKINMYGIPGDTEDMLAVFDACIRVGKLDRAALVLKRFEVIGVLTGEERIVLNNQYLRASLQQIRTNSDLQKVEKLHKWYELQIRNKALPHTAETIACMLKASLLSERGSRLERLVRRYMGMAPDEAGLRVLSMAEILSDQDLAVITDICPTYNFASEAETDELDQVTEQRPAAALGVDATPQNEASKRPLTELLSTPQREIGLASLKQGLRLITELQDVDLAGMTDADRRELQLQIERDSIGLAINKWRHDFENLRKRQIQKGIGHKTADSPLSQHLASWLVSMESRIKHEMKLVDISENKTTKSEQDLERCLYGPLLRQADPARLAAVTILAVLGIGAGRGIDKGIVVTTLITNIAKYAQEDMQMQAKEKQKKLHRRRRLRVARASARSDTSAASSGAVTKDALADTSQTEHNLIQATRQPWSMSIKAHLGSILLKMLLETAKIDVSVEHPVTNKPVFRSQAAFTHTQQPRKGKKTGVVFLNPRLMEQLKREPVGDFIAKYLPMIVEPLPWSGFNKGGFLVAKTSLVRIKSGDIEQRLYTKAAIRCGSLDRVFQGLDVLGKTAWQINKETLDVMMEAWNTGEKIANIPPLHPNLDAPPEPDSFDDPLLKKKWVVAMKTIENEKSALHSQRCYMNLQLEIARAFRNQTLYFPHNVDYRGRAYPIPSYLNHMGADHMRAILKFAQGKELGVRGLRWLKIHLSNVFGLDKSSFDERVIFCDDHLEDIRDSARNPLNGGRWWLKAEDPWQCLSACFELSAALALPDPTKFRSQLPIQQDGTCNGLQHYAALGGDMLGAKQVNLEPGDRPADVYTAVANLVRESVKKDAEAEHQFARILQDKITRKVVKQTVMTNVYGVTFAGAKSQVCKQIDDLYPNLAKETGIPHMTLSSYVARHIFHALASIFSGAHDIQDWLGEVGGRICRTLTPSQVRSIAEMDETPAQGRQRAGKSEGATKPKSGFEEFTQQFRSTVVWTTPLQMPVVQPYRKGTMREIRTCLQSVVYPTNEQTDPVNRRKQLQGFPPNFIHSLDASHMLLSALKCDEAGLAFAAVHDSFWTHAGDIDRMNAILREAFIEIHEEDVVGRLKAEFEARHGGSLFLAYVRPDTSVAKKIKAWRKTAKLTPREELLLEFERFTLLSSKSASDVERAKAMVTPASIFKDMSHAEPGTLAPEEVKATGLGAVSENEGATTIETDPSEPILEGDDDEETSSHTFWDAEIARANLGKSSCNTNGRKNVPVWLPLTVPPIPKKGDFDVKRLRESTYFFS